MRSNYRSTHSERMHNLVIAMNQALQQERGNDKRDALFDLPSSLMKDMCQRKRGNDVVTGNADDVTG
jgi:hypothetical protein